MVLVEYCVIKLYSTEYSIRGLPKPAELFKSIRLIKEPVLAGNFDVVPTMKPR